MENGEGDKEKVSVGAFTGVSCTLRVPWDRPSHWDLFPTDRGALPAMPSSHDCHAPRKVSPQQNGCTQQVQGECLHRLRHRGSINVSGWWASHPSCGYIAGPAGMGRLAQLFKIR